MKKLFSIVLTLLILISTVHLTLATHNCGGKFAAVKYSLSGTKATCGMENDIENNGITKLKSNCCHDHLTLLKVDHNYNPSSLHILNTSSQCLQVFTVPSSINFATLQFLSHRFQGSPQNYTANAVSLGELCTFRI